MDTAAILACPIMVVGVVMYAAPPNQVSKETPTASCSPRLGKVIVSVNVAVGSEPDLQRRQFDVRFALDSNQTVDLPVSPERADCVAKVEVAGPRIFRENTKRESIADSY